MPDRKHDIERYLKGQMSASEMHALEKEALNDPFIADALEGIDHMGADRFLIDLSDLRRSVKHRSKRKPKMISMWQWSLGIAAGLVAIAICSVYIIGQLSVNRNNPLALENKKEKAVDPPVIRDTLSIDHEDSLEEQAPLQAQKPKSASAEKSGTAKTPATQETFDQLSPVAQSESIDHKPERIVDVELSEVPYQVMRKDNSKGIASKAADGDPVITAPRIIKGKVVANEDGDGMPGVNVIVKGTAIGTITGVDGKYELKLPHDTATLQFASIGYKSEEIKADNEHEANVVLENDAAQLSEVVVVGSGDPRMAETFKMAEPAGGRKNFQQYLTQQLHYPEQALSKKIQGKVTVLFTVSSSGSLDDFRIIKGIGHGCDEELIRLIKEGPKWTPSKQNNQPVSDKVKVRLKFQIPD